jgi:integrase
MAQARGLRHDNPAESVHEILPEPQQQQPRPALLTFPQLGGVLRSAEAAHLTPAVRMAHRLTAFSAERISNVVEAQWCEFDLEATVPMWIIPRAQMKRKKAHHAHKAILPPLIADELREWRRIIGTTGYLFPSPAGGKHITRESLEKAYRETLGLRDKHCPHGWRAAFSTLANDSERFDPEVVEMTLDHVHANAVVRAYDRGERLEQRIKLMAWWGQQLDQAQQGGEVVPLRQAA